MRAVVIAVCLLLIFAQFAAAGVQSCKACMNAVELAQNHLSTAKRNNLNTRAELSKITTDITDAVCVKGKCPFDRKALYKLVKSTWAQSHLAERSGNKKNVNGVEIDRLDVRTQCERMDYC